MTPRTRHRIGRGHEFLLDANPEDGSLLRRNEYGGSRKTVAPDDAADLHRIFLYRIVLGRGPGSQAHINPFPNGAGLRLPDFVRQPWAAHLAHQIAVGSKFERLRSEEHTSEL